MVKDDDANETMVDEDWRQFAENNIEYNDDDAEVKEVLEDARDSSQTQLNFNPPDDHGLLEALQELDNRLSDLSLFSLPSQSFETETASEEQPTEAEDNSPGRVNGSADAQATGSSRKKKPKRKDITDRKSTRLNSSHNNQSRMPSSA